MRLLSVVVFPAIVGALLVSAGASPVHTISPANVNAAPAGDPKAPVTGSRPEVQRSARDLDRDRDAALSLIFLLGMGRRPVGSP